MSEVTRILNSIEQGDSNPAARLLPLVHDEMRSGCSQRRRSKLKDEKTRSYHLERAGAMNRIAIVALVAALSCAAVLLTSKAFAVEPTWEGKKVDTWLEQLRSADEKERGQAQLALKRWHNQQPLLVRTLASIVADKGKQEAVREAALQALAGLGDAAIPSVSRLLWSEDKLTRMLGLLACQQFGARAKPAMPSALRLLKSEHAEERQLAMQALAAAGDGSAIAHLEPFLKADVVTRAHAIEALIQLDYDSAKLLPGLLEWLGEEESQHVALKLLTSLEREARPAVAALVKALVAKSPAVRAQAAVALGKIGGEARAAAAPLLRAVREEQVAIVQLLAAKALWAVDRTAAVPALLKKRLQDEAHPEPLRTAQTLWHMEHDPLAVQVVARSLARSLQAPKRTATERDDIVAAMSFLAEVGPASAAALEVVTPLLGEREPVLRQWALAVLLRMGPRARPAQGKLQAVMKGFEAETRLAAAVALFHSEQDATALRLIVDSLKDEQLGLQAAVQLNSLRMQARGAGKLLGGALPSTRGRSRAELCEALWRMERHPDALPALIEMLAHPDPEWRSTAALAIGASFGREGKAAVPALVRCLWDEDAEVPNTAAEALGRIGPDERGLEPLLTLLRSPDVPPNVLSAVVEAVGLYGPAAKEAAPRLRELLAHPRRYVQVLAAKALWEVVGSKAGLESVRAGLNARLYQVRVIAAETAWAMEQHAQSIEVLEHTALGGFATNDNDIFMACRALGRIGPQAKSALLIVRNLTDHGNVHVADAAREAARRIERAP